MIKSEDIQAAICCPGGCLDPRRCEKHARRYRDAAHAVLALIKQGWKEEMNQRAEAETTRARADGGFW